MRLKIIVVVALAIALGTGIAYASIPDSNGVIHGCYKNSTGMLKVIDSSSQSCASGETALDWNQTGPQGPQGPAGPAGQNATALWAYVLADGSFRGSHVSSVSHPGGGSGSTTVTFDQDVSQCSYLATAAQSQGVIRASSNGSDVQVQNQATISGSNDGAISVAVFC